MLTEVGWAAAVAVVSLVGSLLQGHSTFHPKACVAFEPYMNQYLVGQEPSLRVLTDAVCDFVPLPAKMQMNELPKNNKKPLVVSLHGPPGVGKTYFHQLAARVLYNGNETVATHCPGRHCSGYKVLFGMDYTAKDREEQHAMLQTALLEHVSMYPQSFIVVEEYDKLDCHMRGFFRQILQGGTVGNQSLSESIIVLESNLGYSVLHNMLEKAGSRHDINMDAAQRALKDMVFTMWQNQKCEEFSDSQKLIRSIDFFLPFYPLEKQHIEALFRMKLDEYSKRAGKNVTYGEEVIEYLVDKVEFDGKYPIEGGKEVNTVTTGYVSRPFRRWQQQLGANSNNMDDANTSSGAQYSWVVRDNALEITS